LRQFVRERDWEQFHTPRNLILALVGEVGELAELFQWLSDEQVAAAVHDPNLATRIREELADVFSYVLRLSDILGISLGEALIAKIRLNAERYPVERVRGSAIKYTHLDG
jgi:NTP pyrophosphatase (non-canonical NTP hydrolase)